MKAIITIGLPASGKSSWARKKAEDQPFLVLERDQIRRSMVPDFRWDTWDVSREPEVAAKLEQQIREAATSGLDIIVSDTNLRRGAREKLISLLRQLGYEVEVALFATPKSVCYVRNRKRKAADQVAIDAYYKLDEPLISSMEDIKGIPITVIRNGGAVCGCCQNYKPADAPFGSMGYCDKEKGLIERARLWMADHPCHKT